MVSGKLALVTGGGSGIGRATCQLLARDGATVIAADINELSARDTTATLVGSDHMAVHMDITCQSSIAASLAAVQKRYAKPAACIVNSAGINIDIPMCELSEEAFTETIDVNLKGTFLVNKLTTQALVAAGRTGAVVNISSINANTGNCGMTHYAASKAGVIALTKSAAKEHAKDGIRYNAVLPGYIDTPMNDRKYSKEEASVVIETVLMRRAGRPEEVAELIVFLASEKASYMTGSCVVCAGGLFL